MLVLAFQALTAALCLSTGILVFVRAPREPGHLSFSLFSVFSGLWLVLGFIWNLQVQLGVLSDLTPRISMAMVCLAANSLAVFSCYFPQPRSGISTRIVLGSYALALLVAGLSFTSASFQSIQLLDGRLVRDFGPLYAVFALYTGGSAVGAVFNLAFTYRRLRFNVERQKVRYVFFGLLLAVPITVGFMLILPYFGIGEMFFAGQSALLVFIGFSAYAIIRYRALDISSVAVKTLMFLITTSVALVVIYFGVRWARPWLASSSDLMVSLFGLGLFGLVMIYYRLIKPWLERRLPYNVNNLTSLLERLNRDLSHLRTLEELGAGIERHLREIFQPVRFSILAHQEGRGLRHLLGEIPDSTFAPNEHGRFLAWLERTDEVVELGHIEINPAYQEIREDAEAYFYETGAAVVVPLIFDRFLLGVIHLGPKANTQDYVPTDLRLLTLLRHDLSLALSNSRLFQKINTLYREVKETSENLEMRVAQRTTELESALTQLRRVDQLKSDFIATASHELRTPTTAVKGSLDRAMELQQQGDAGQKLHGFLQMCNRNVERLVNLINDLLDLSRLESGKLSLEFNPLSLAEVFQSALETVGPLLARKQVRVRQEIPASLPLVPGDRDRLRQVAVNLLDNAIKFSPAGRNIWISAQIQAGRLVCQVRDEGEGIAAENQLRIFDKFWRSETFSKDREEGTGLGLAIVKIIVELHRGRVWVESEPGKGSSFFIELPVSPPDMVNAA